MVAKAEDESEEAIAARARQKDQDEKEAYEERLKAREDARTKKAKKTPFLLLNEDEDNNDEHVASVT